MALEWETEDELRFLRKMAREKGFDAVRNYRAALHKRVLWMGIDKQRVLKEANLLLFTYDGRDRR